MVWDQRKSEKKRLKKRVTYDAIITCRWKSGAILTVSSLVPYPTSLKTASTKSSFVYRREVSVPGWDVGAICCSSPGWTQRRASQTRSTSIFLAGTATRWVLTKRPALLHFQISPSLRPSPSLPTRLPSSSAPLALALAENPFDIHAPT